MIRLIFPPESLKVIKRMGLKQSERERLRWSDQHPASSYGLGVLLRGQSDHILDGDQFKTLHTEFGATIECSTELEQQRVMNALAWRALGLPEDTVRKQLDKFISVQAAAVVLGVSERHMRRLAAKGRVRGATKIGRDWLIPSPPNVLRRQKEIET